MATKTYSSRRTKTTSSSSSSSHPALQPSLPNHNHNHASPPPLYLYHPLRPGPHRPRPRPRHPAHAAGIIEMLMDLNTMCEDLMGPTRQLSVLNAPLALLGIGPWAVHRHLVPLVLTVADRHIHGRPSSMASPTSPPPSLRVPRRYPVPVNSPRARDSPSRTRSTRSVPPRRGSSVPSPRRRGLPLPRSRCLERRWRDCWGLYRFVLR